MTIMSTASTIIARRMTTLTVTITVVLDASLEVVASGVEERSVDTSPGQSSDGVLEFTAHTLDTVRGRN